MQVVGQEPGTSAATLHPLVPLQGLLPQEGEEEGGEGDHSSVHSCDTEGYYTTFHDFDGFQVGITVH